MVRGQTANTRVTVDLGSAALYRSVKVLAAYQGRSLREVVAEALRDWVEKQEEREDLEAIAEVEHEPLVPLGEARREWAE
ncbi:MAG: hypothetical protein Q8P22_06015 [Chloroflexota bacterium]|nr:hypothetical protein [Chloroflexota bacterium]